MMRLVVKRRQRKMGLLSNPDVENVILYFWLYLNNEYFKSYLHVTTSCSPNFYSAWVVNNDRRIGSWPHLNAVALPGGVPEHEDRDAREEAGQEGVEAAALAEVVGVAVHQARGAEGSAAT
jgi:hypothetical protein